MKSAWLRMICPAAAGLLIGLFTSQDVSAKECPCFKYNGAVVHDNYTEHSATNKCPAKVNFLSRAAQFGSTQLFESGETRTWRCDGGKKFCGELRWQQVENCPEDARERSQPRRSRP